MSDFAVSFPFCRHYVCFAESAYVNKLYSHQKTRSSQYTHDGLARLVAPYCEKTFNLQQGSHDATPLHTIVGLVLSDH